MHKHALHFLVAAKRCELRELDQLMRTSALVKAVAHLVHELQRERGLSNLFLACAGLHWQQERLAQIGRCCDALAAVQHSFDGLDTESADLRQGARLFARIALALQGLEALVHLRQWVHQQALGPVHASAHFSRLISTLLAVVFEAADSATEPEISRALVALFNFMQGKEFAGQERATGSAMFAAAQVDSEGQQRLLHLIESQERCLQTFRDFATPVLCAHWAAAPQAEDLAQLERMRRIVCTSAPGQALSGATGQEWFDACTARIDTMKQVEDRLTGELAELCHQRMTQADKELAQLMTLQDSPPAADPEPHFLSAGMPAAGSGTADGANSQDFGPLLGRSMLQLVQEQSRRLQAVEDELDTVRASLNERKLIERAKGLLMAHRQLSEDAAHKTMRQMAMNQNRRLVEVAEAVLAMADMLPARSH